MKTLKELCDVQSITKKTDTEILIEWATENDYTEQLVVAITQVLLNKLKQQRERLNYARTNIPLLVVNPYINCGTTKKMGKTTKEEQNLFNYATAKFILEEELDSDLLGALDAQMSKRTRPVIFFAPFLDYLKSKGISFMEDGK